MSVYIEKPKKETEQNTTGTGQKYDNTLLESLIGGSKSRGTQVKKYKEERNE